MFSTLLEYNADPRALVYTTPGLNSPRTAKPRYISVLSLINDVFSKWDPEGADSLRSRLPHGLAADLRQLQLLNTPLDTGRLLPSLKLPSEPPLASPRSAALLSPSDSPLSPTNKKLKRRSFTRFLSSGRTRISRRKLSRSI